MSSDKSSHQTFNAHDASQTRAWVVRARQLQFEPAAHEDPNMPGSLKKVLARRDDLPPGRVQMVNWAKLPTGRSFREHLHQDMLEVFVIASGQAEVHVHGAAPIALGPGDAWFVPSGVRHKMRCAGTEDTFFVVFGISSESGGRTVVTEGVVE